jgi:hypothetical protein
VPYENIKKTHHFEPSPKHSPTMQLTKRCIKSTPKAHNYKHKKLKPPNNDLLRCQSLAIVTTCECFDKYAGSNNWN